MHLNSFSPYFQPSPASETFKAPNPVSHVPQRTKSVASLGELNDSIEDLNVGGTKVEKKRRILTAEVNWNYFYYNLL